jgi:prepilin-type N-terminal cleavage/methylation domain-containing protein
MHNPRSRGFTLIELLVVIAIIGILSAVVLASLNQARTKGNDASVQANLSTIMTQAEIYYGNQNPVSYGSASHAIGTCANTANTLFADPTIWRAIQSAQTANGSAEVKCFSNGTAYVVSSQLPTTLTGTAAYWCVDSTGSSGRETADFTTGTTCP